MLVKRNLFFKDPSPGVGSCSVQVRSLLDIAKIAPMACDISYAAKIVATNFKDQLMRCHDLDNMDLTFLAQQIMEPDFSFGYVPRGALLELLVEKGLDPDKLPDGASMIPQGRILIDNREPRGIKIDSAEEEILNNLKGEISSFFSKENGMPVSGEHLTDESMADYFTQLKK